MENNPSSSRIDKKTIEKNRRNHMKTLYSQLNSLVPQEGLREVTSVPDQLQEATNYIKRLQINLEKLKEKKDSLLGKGWQFSSSSSRVTTWMRAPQIEVREIGGAILEIVLITSLDSQFVFNETIRILHEEGSEVVNANFSVLESVVFHTIHAKIEESSSSGGGAARISRRLENFFKC